MAKSKLKLATIIFLCLWLLSMFVFGLEVFFFVINPATKNSIVGVIQTRITLSTIGFGVLSFILLLIAGFIHLFRKIHAWAIVIVLSLLLIFTTVSIIAGFIIVPKVINGYKHPQMNSDTILTEVNNYRVQQGLNVVTKSDRDCQVAAVRLLEVENSFSHNGFSAKRFCDDTHTSCHLGENLATDISPEQAVVDAWIASPEHQKIMTDKDFKYACVTNDGKYTVLTMSNVNSY